MCNPSGWPAGECYRLVPQSPGLWMLALGHRCQHSDAQPAVSGAFCGRCGKTAEIEIIFHFKLNTSFTVISNCTPLKWY